MRMPPTGILEVKQELTLPSVPCTPRLRIADCSIPPSDPLRPLCEKPNAKVGDEAGADV
jgi:hypothetical protein